MHASRPTDIPTSPAQAVCAPTCADPRPLLLVAIAYGILVWQVGPTGLATIAVGVLGALAHPLVRRRRTPGMVRGLVRFCAFWGLLKFALDMLVEVPDVAGALAGAALLSGRLALLGGIGMALTLAVSPRALALALAWLLRPLMGDAAWRPALALALMLHFLPLTQRTVAQVLQSAAQRQPHGGLRRRLTLVPAAILRILGQRTWQQTVALAVRGLDTAEAWRPCFAPARRVWLWAVLLTIAGWGLVLLPA